MRPGFQSSLFLSVVIDGGKQPEILRFAQKDNGTG